MKARYQGITKEEVYEAPIDQVEVKTKNERD